MKVEIRKDFNAPLSARCSGWKYINTYHETEVTYSLRIDAHRCPDNVSCAVLLSQLNKVHSVALDREKRACPRDGIVRVTVKPWLVARVGNWATDDYSLGFLYSQRMIVGEERGVQAQNYGSSFGSRPQDELQEPSASSATHQSTGSTRGSQSLSPDSRGRSQQTIHEGSEYEVRTLVQQEFEAPKLHRRTPTYNGESSWSEKVEAFTVPTHQCGSDEPCSKIVSALQATLDTALKTNKHPFGGEVGV